MAFRRDRFPALRNTLKLKVTVLRKYNQENLKWSIWVFGRRNKNKTSNNEQDLLREFLDHQFDAEQMIEAAKADARSIALLKPMIPMGDGQSAGWFGGKAALPKDMPWPTRDGKKLVFVGQINLEALPKDIWSGVGPRNGWLALFLPAEGELEPTLLHFDGPLFETDAPCYRASPQNASWTRCHNFNEPNTSELPKWPIIVESCPSNELHDIEEPRQQSNQVPGTLLDAAYHPFDFQTRRVLLSCLSKTVIDMVKRTVRFPAMKKLRPKDAAWFENQKKLMLGTFARFFEIEGEMYVKRDIGKDQLDYYLSELQKLDVCDFDYKRDDPEGYCELILRESKLLDPQPERSSLSNWWVHYNTQLTNHALAAYTSGSQSLPDALRRRLETKWKMETVFGLSAMGHAPRGHIYTPHGAGSQNEVLLELHTSDIAGWIWGDCYSLVLTIKRSDLSRGDFRSVGFEITN